MSFDKQYPNRKDKRKQYYDHRAIDATCRSHGTCAACQSARKHKVIKQQPTVLLEEYN